MKRIIFVCSNTLLRKRLNKTLSPLRNKWKIVFVVTGQRALDIMERTSVDFIITEVSNNIGINGTNLLSEITKRFPQVVRIAFIKNTDKEITLRFAGLAHQYISETFDSEKINSCLSRACFFHELLINKQLREVVCSLNSLPSIPSIYMELIEEINSPDVSISKIGNIISRDIGMTAKVMQLANSALFGTRSGVSNPSAAVNLLGINIIYALLFVSRIFSEFEKTSQPTGFSIEKVWQHSLMVGTLAKKISIAEKQSRSDIDASFVGGLLHDAGKLVLSAYIADKYSEVVTIERQTNKNLYEAEIEIFNITHAEVGACLMGIWGAESSIIDAILFHHTPFKCNCFSPAVSVHIADAFMYKTGITKGKGQRLEISYLKELGLEDRIQVWFEICKELMNTNNETPC